VRSLVFAPDNRTLAVCTGVAVKVWDSAINQELYSLSGGVGAAFSPDGTLLAYPGQDENNNDGLMLWDISGKDFKPEEVGKGKKRIFIPDDNVRCPVFSPNGKTIAAAVGGKVKFWEVATGKEGEPLAKEHKSSVNAVVYVNGGKSIVSGDARGVVVLWDISDPAAPKKSGDYKQPGSLPITSISAPAGGNAVAVSTGGGVIAVLDTATLKELSVIRTGTGAKPVAVKGAAVSPDGRLIASTTADQTDLETKLWDAASRQQVVSFLAHQNVVNCVAFSPDGGTLATGSDDRSVKLWSVATLLALNAPKPAPPKPAK
jgi:WD40 repeat protein